MTASSWYRQGIWFLKGRREYTKQGYEYASSKFSPKDLDVDCSDRHFMITGSNSGIGFATAVEIAKRGGVLHLVCRNTESMKEARSNIITTTGNDKVYQHQLNLSVPQEVHKWASEFARSHDRLDCLIHNAGCMLHERTLDQNNIESNFAVNVLAIHIINTHLIPLIQKSEDGRVITVSSGGMLNVKLDSQDLTFEKMNPFDGTMAYAQNKRQQIVMSFCNAQRYENVRFYSMHPGWADTPAVRTAMPKFHEAMKDKLRTPEQGADTIVWLAVSKAALQHASGLFFQDRKPVPTHLPLAWTRSSFADEEKLMLSLDELATRTKPVENLDTNITVQSIGDTVSGDASPTSPRKDDTDEVQENVSENGQILASPNKKEEKMTVEEL